MVMEIANTTIDVLRGTTVNSSGDKLDVGEPVYTDVPACLLEDAVSTQDPATQTPRTIRASSCVVAGFVDVKTNDTIRDRATDNYYSIITMKRQQALYGGDPDIMLTLRSRTGVSARTD